MSTQKPSRPKHRRWRGRLLALGIGYLLVELVVVPVIAWKAPLSVRVHLPSPLYVISQTSKASLVPEDYVLIVGDSYAEGHGDWLTEALEQGGNLPFQAGDVLHAATGRDVLSFGRGGADSVSSCVYLVTKRFAALRRLGLGEPERVVVFFYAGNDLNENLKQARKRLGLGDGDPAQFTAEDIDAGIAGRARKGLWSGLAGNLYLPYLLIDLAQGHTSGGTDGAGKRHVRALEPEEAGENVVRTAAGRFSLGGPPQGPALELNEDELALTLSVFERSLRWARQRFEGLPMGVVYIPSPLACYELESADYQVQTYLGRDERYGAASIRQRSDRLRAQIAQSVRALGLTFIDATPDLRRAAEREMIHGPRDGRHFNRLGYECLGELLSRELQSLSVATCRP